MNRKESDCPTEQPDPMQAGHVGPSWAVLRKTPGQRPKQHCCNPTPPSDAGAGGVGLGKATQPTRT
jgi:hypothetical protein